MYNFLSKLIQKPTPFSTYSAIDLWNDGHISKQMLKYHLDSQNDISSRNSKSISKICSFLTNKLKIDEHKTIIDYGCGPGLYCQHFAETGAKILGIDCSSRSLAYARQNSHQKKVTYVNASYLEYIPQIKANIAFLIYFDLCALSPNQRKILYQNIHQTLHSNSYFVFDLFSLEAMKERKEIQKIEKNLMNGFWKEEEYMGILQTFIYPAPKVVLDKYDIITAKQHHQIYNWLEYFDIEKITEELKQNGFSIESYYSNLDGSPYFPESKELAIIAKKI